MPKKLADYNFPGDLKDMDISQLKSLAPEIRDFLIQNLSKTGGHLASNLGVVELTLAIHKTFDSPKDKIIWDVGHQSYVHKILTGRAGAFDTLRQKDGLSGFPKTAESIHDVFDTGHASNSLSVAAGLSCARDLAGNGSHVVAVIGDGALTGGLAYEALNNIGGAKSRVIVVLNDNGMSISKNIGGVSRHLNKIRVSGGYYKFKGRIRKLTKSIPVVGEGIYTGIQRIRDRIKYAVINGGIFEQLGFTYLGPIDGHDLKQLTEGLELARHAKGPVVLHALTEKGKGYKSAEQNPDKFHGTGPFDPSTGCPLKSQSFPTYSEVFGEELEMIAEEDTRVVAITAAMTDGTGLSGFACRYPSRTYDVGIAESHAVTFAAGLAAGGLKPVVAIYSTFLQRAYDQIMMDVCLQGLPVIFAIDRAGNVGADGETHHGLFDISFLKSMPGMTLLAPRDCRELRSMLRHAMKLDGPSAIRYPRGNCPDFGYPGPEDAECAQVLMKGGDIALWSVGNMAGPALEIREILATQGILAEVCDVRCLKPLDTSTLLTSAAGKKWIVTLEDHALIGGFGETAAALAKANGIQAQMLHLGWPDTFIEHGSCEEIYKQYGLDAPGMAERIRQAIESKT